MARAEKLTALEVDRHAKGKAARRWCDGAGLWLQAGGAGSASWLLRYMKDRVQREMGLGSYPLVSLADARERARTFRRQAKDGTDPIAARRAERARGPVGKTFLQVFAEYFRKHRRTWSRPHAWQWLRTMRADVLPTLGQLNVADIDTPIILRLLTPLWQEKTQTASKLRGRIEKVLAYAALHGYRIGANPASWTGHLVAGLPSPNKAAPVKHHAALPYKEAPALMQTLLAPDATTDKLALAFMVLTGVRTANVLNARRSELEAEAWNCPAGSMKSKVPFRVPLTPLAVHILGRMPDAGPASRIFAKRGRRLGVVAMKRALRAIVGEVYTGHGLRATFRTWIGEMTDTPLDLAEACIAHIPGSLVAAYSRGELFTRRREVMLAWDAFLGGEQLARLNGAGTISTLAGRRRAAALR